MTPLLLQALGPVVIGVVGLFVRQMANQAKASAAAIVTVATEVKEIARDVKRHGESLAAGNEKFRGIERRLDRIEENLESIQRDGCNHRKDCA